MKDSIFKLNEMPVKFFPHDFISRNVILSKEISRENYPEQVEKIKFWLNQLNDFFVPLALLTDIDINNDLAGLKVISFNESDYYWVNYLNFIIKHNEIENIAILNLDVAEMESNPFSNFSENTIYISDTLETISRWSHFQTGIKEVDEFVSENKNLQLLGMDVIAGDRGVVIEFISLMIREQVKNNVNLDDIQTLLLFNFVVYNFFSDRFVHGRQVSSIGEFNQKDVYSWFKLK